MASAPISASTAGAEEERGEQSHRGEQTRLTTAARRDSSQRPDEAYTPSFFTAATICAISSASATRGIYGSIGGSDSVPSCSSGPVPTCGSGNRSQCLALAAESIRSTPTSGSGIGAFLWTSAFDQSIGLEPSCHQARKLRNYLLIFSQHPYFN